eukprot:4512112-Pyramimonas_sp.AAC.1
MGQTDGRTFAGSGNESRPNGVAIFFAQAPGQTRVRVPGHQCENRGAQHQEEEASTTLDIGILSAHWVYGSPRPAVARRCQRPTQRSSFPTHARNQGRRLQRPSWFPTTLPEWASELPR